MKTPEQRCEEDERWVDLSGRLEGYGVSSLGRIMGKKGGIIKPRINMHGYVAISLKHKGKSFNTAIHRIVAIGFLQANDKPELEVNHIDGNKLNNCLSNLEMVTAKQNMQHRSRVLGKCRGESTPMAVLKEPDVLKAIDLVKSGLTFEKTAEALGVTRTAISCIIRRKTWTHVTDNLDVNLAELCGKPRLKKCLDADQGKGE